MKIINIKLLGSTNAFAEQQINENKIKETSCIVAYHQSEGKGRGKNIWESEKGKNLTISVACFPVFLPAEKQFFLNKAMALSVYDLVSELVPKKTISIKWPNDIYIGDEKVAGMLIQSAVQNNKIKYAIIGIGININQEKFPVHLPNPTSVIKHSKSAKDLVKTLKNYLSIFEKYYEMLKSGMMSEIDSKYLQALYRFGQRSAFNFDKQKIHACICGVNEYGWLQLVSDDGTLFSGDMNKVKMILEV